MADEVNLEIDAPEPSAEEQEIIDSLENGEEDIAYVDDGKSMDEDEEEEPEKKIEVNPLEEEIARLKADKKGLNTALHQARQDRKSKKVEVEEEETLTDEQLQDMLKEHGDDPELVFNILKYTAQKTTKEQADVSKIAQIKTDQDAYVLDRWPDMADEDSDIYKSVDETKKSLQVDNHPLGDYIALSALINEELPNLQQASYDQGVADAKSGTVATKRKTNNLTPSGKKAAVKSSISASALKTAKQMGLTPSQYKIYKKRILKIRGN